MGWSIGWDSTWKRDIGYGVPAYCDHPGCLTEIDRGLGYVCGGEPFGGETGCGLYFCGAHLCMDRQKPLCEACIKDRTFDPTPDHPRWVKHKLTHSSWKSWRLEHPDEVKTMEEHEARANR